MYKQPYLLNFVKSFYAPLSKNGMNRASSIGVIAFLVSFFASEQTALRYRLSLRDKSTALAMQRWLQ